MSYVCCATYVSLVCANPARLAVLLLEHNWRQFTFIQSPLSTISTEGSTVSLFHITPVKSLASRSISILLSLSPNRYPKELHLLHPDPNSLTSPQILTNLAHRAQPQPFTTPSAYDQDTINPTTSLSTCLSTGRSPMRSLASSLPWSQLRT